MIVDVEITYCVLCVVCCVYEAAETSAQASCVLRLALDPDSRSLVTQYYSFHAEVAIPF